MEEASPFSVASTVDVKATLAGEAQKQVIIYQLGQLDDDESNLLEIGEEYILFLDKQQNDEPNSYYIIGGGVQGKFMREDEKIENDDIKMKEDLEKNFNTDK